MDPHRLRTLYEMLSEETGLDAARIYRNAPVPVLYEEALKHEHGSAIVANGALATRSGSKTGRSPKDKRVVNDEKVWWGPVNIALDERIYEINRARAIDYLRTRERIFVFDGFAGWHPQHR